jgi:anti-anti-sigma factor
MFSSKFNKEKNTLTIRFDTDLLSSVVEQNSGALELEIGSSPAHKELILDLTACKMVDSVGLNLLFGIVHHAQSKKVNASIRIFKGPLERILEVSQIRKIAPVTVM